MRFDSLVHATQYCGGFQLQTVPMIDGSSRWRARFGINTAWYYGQTAEGAVDEAFKCAQEVGVQNYAPKPPARRRTSWDRLSEPDPEEE